ncbi:MAG: molybdopterin-dependent oxidoreductase [Pseudomonadota bacterium]
MAETRSVCCYCGVGCGVIIEHDGARITGVRGDPEHPANRGRLCTKGATLHLTAQAGGRCLYPELRQDKAGERQRVSWEVALETAAERFAAIIREHGPEAVGIYLSGQLSTEDYYVFNKLMKGLIGSNNVDTNSRLCMSSAVAGYKATLGADAPPACYDDIDHAGTLFIAGSNTAWAHPVLYRRIEAAREANPHLKLVVVDPRRTETAREADLHLPILPGSDVALFNAMLHVLIAEGRIDADYIAAHTEGWAALHERVKRCSPEWAASVCGVPAEAIVQAARWFADGPTLSLYCQGLNQSRHGVDKNATLINLHLATGQIGRPGCGPFSLTGQSNAMGGREVGGLSNLLPAHRDLSNPAHRAEVARLWGVDSVPAKPGRPAVELFEAARRGELKALWVVCTNPAHSLPNQTWVREALARVDFLIVQEAYADTETAAYADLLLPAASWGEKDGSMTNSERRISRLRAAVPPPGEARADWAIAVDFARRLEAKLGRAKTLFPYETVEQVWNEHRETTRGRDLDITGLSYALLDAQGPQQWPFPEGTTTGRARLYADGVFPSASGRARFHCAHWQPVAEPADAEYPLSLTTGRLRDQWHTLSRTGLVPRLYNHAEAPRLAMHPADLARRSLSDGDLVRVRSRRGQLVLPVAADADQRAGQVFLPMHWGGRFMAGLGTNVLTVDACDAVSGQPELKHAAVEVEAAGPLHPLLLMLRGAAAEWLARLRHLLGQFDYASLGLAGREHAVVVLRAASAQPLDAARLAQIDRLAGLDDAAAMSYFDAGSGISKRARLDAGRLVAVRLYGETAAQDWLKQCMVEAMDVGALRPWLLAPLAAPPQGQVAPGRIVCNCRNVAESAIRAAIAEGADLAALQAGLRCGTECGSCLPEVKRLLAQQAVPA